MRSTNKGHFYTTLEWAETQLQAKNARKIGTYEWTEMPNGVSVYDFLSDIRYLDNFISGKSGRRLNLLMHIDQTLAKRLAGAENKAKELAEEIASLKKEYLSDHVSISDLCIDRKNKKIYNQKNPKQNVSFKNSTKGWIIAEHLYDHLGEMFDPHDIAKHVEGLIDEKDYTARDVQNLWPSIEKKFKEADSWLPIQTHHKYGEYGLMLK